MEIINHFIKKCQKKELLDHSLLTFYHFSEANPERIKAVIDVDMINSILEILVSHSTPELKLKALNFICSLANNSDSNVVFTLIECESIKILAKVIQDNHKILRKEACFILSIMVVNMGYQLQTVFDYNNAEIIKNLIAIVSNDDKDVGFVSFIFISLSFPFHFHCFF